MLLSHYFYLYPAYGTALLGYHIYTRQKHLPKTNKVSFAKPWLEFVLALCAAVFTIGIGQLYMAKLLLPTLVDFRWFTESINQLLIFSPFIGLLLIRRHTIQTAWIPQKKRLVSILVGFLLALFALVIFFLSKYKELRLDWFLEIYTAKNLPHLVQVFFEDFAIAIVLCRLIVWIGTKWAIVFVAFLFAAGHIPAMLANGISLYGFVPLLFDMLLGIVVLGVVARSKNFLWFWMVHYALDMTQFIN